MAREATINVSLTPRQLRLVREQVESGHYASASEVVREGLRALFGPVSSAGNRTAAEFRRHLTAGYKATAEHDRRLAHDWAELADAWPEK